MAHYTMITAPLTSLLAIALVEWTKYVPVVEGVFGVCTTALLSSGKPFILQTDASEVGVSAKLFQRWTQSSSRKILGSWTWVFSYRMGGCTSQVSFCYLCITGNSDGYSKMLYQYQTNKMLVTTWGFRFRNLAHVWSRKWSSQRAITLSNETEYHRIRLFGRGTISKILRWFGLDQWSNSSEWSSQRRTMEMSHY